jgi:hypothetical protein
VSEEEWQEQVTSRGRRSPLHGLHETPAFTLVYEEQPFRRGLDVDPLPVVNRLDNRDKHRLLSMAFVYPRAECGTDLVRVMRPGLVRESRSLWTSGDPLMDRTPLAEYLLLPATDARRVLRADPDARLGFATGDLDGERTTYEEMIERARGIVDRAVKVIEAHDP